MFCRMGAAVVAALGLWASPAWAQFSDVKTLRLGDVPTMKLGEAGTNADTQLVRHGGGFHHSGFHHSGFHHSGFHNGFHHAGFHNGFHHAGFHNGFHHGFHHFHHGFHNRFHRSFFSVGFWPSFYGFRNFYSPYYYPSYGFYGGGYQPDYYYAPPVYYYSPSCSYPISLTTTTFGAYSPVMPLAPQNGGPVPGGGPVPAPGGAEDGTFPYDGGPASPVPMPKAEPMPSREPVRPAPKPEGRIVSLPAPTTHFAYPAYGEKPAPTSFAQDRPLVRTNDPVKSARR
ncbi:MAG: hypothetical protein HYS12_20665 [Planctomycetes bacterium]|nr:hypothetical protein [Planctomycetota bacterium]